ncbi:MAG: hypothetical protein KAS66_15080 [Candidatus Omnitrophica bacterium]|nr:hypothetical protein [Candidatus Omnitrophota bacterium]
MKMILSENEKASLNEKFKEQGSTIETIDEWLRYEARLLEEEVDSVYADFLNKREILNEIGEEQVKEELDNL